MAEFTVYDEETAQGEARPMLAAANRRLGVVSTLSGVMAESPDPLAGYNAVSGQFNASSLPRAAKQVVLINASAANDCRYCVAAHSTMALRAGLEPSTVEALRTGKPLDDAALEAVHRFTHAVVACRSGSTPIRSTPFWPPVTPAGTCLTSSSGGGEDAFQLHQPHHRCAARPG